MPESSAASLTQIAYYGRQGVKITIITLISLIVGRVLLTATVNYWVATHPPAPPPPTVGFGQLPPLRFPTQTSQDKPQQYQLQMATGNFPRFPDRAKVFLMPQSAPSLLADQRAKEIGANLGFTSIPNALNDRTYRWTKSTPLEETLNLDIQDYTFSLTTNYLSKPELLAQNNLPIESAATQAVKSFVGSTQPLGDDIATVSGTVSYLKAVGGQVTAAVSFSDADFLKVDLNRAPIDNRWQTYTSDGVSGIIQAIVSGSFQGKDQLMQVIDNYHPVDYSQVQTYPLMSVTSAWQALQAGAGYIAQKGTASTAVIRQVSLGYYDDDQDQPYFQPIYVFTGDNGFIGFVPAVNPTWISSAAAVQ